MTILFANQLDTETHPHGTAMVQAWQRQSVVQTWFGLSGEQHLNGKQNGRDISIWLWLLGYGTHEEVHDDIELINDLAGEFGTLRVDLGSDSKDFENCVFMGFAPEEAPWLDGSGTNGWNCKGTLTFRQIKQ